MKKQEELYHEITEMIKATKDGTLRWSVEVQTTEANPPEEKPVEEENEPPGRWMNVMSLIIANTGDVTFA